MGAPAEPVIETQPVPSATIAGFWRRIGALLVDGLVLGAVGFPLGFLLGERFAPVGTPARLIGLLVEVPYLTLLGSRIGGGQTLGKRLLRLRVVDADGQPLPPGRALVRALLLSLPWAFNGVRFGSKGPVVLATLWIAGVLVFGVGGAIVGTYLLNRRTRQALHDLVAGSYVVEASGLGSRVPVASTRRPLAVSVAWLTIVAVGMGTLAAAAPKLVAGELAVVADTVASVPGVTSLEVKSFTSRGREGTSKVIVAALWYRGPAGGERHAAGAVAAALLQHHPDAASAPNLAVTVIRGWDIGIAQSTRVETFARSPSRWRAELGR